MLPSGRMSGLYVSVVLWQILLHCGHFTLNIISACYKENIEIIKNTNKSIQQIRYRSPLIFTL